MKFALLLVLLCIQFPVALHAQTLTACGHPFYPPVSWVENGQLKGLGPKVVQLLFHELGHEVKLLANSNWKRCLHEVELGNIDIVVAAYRIPSRTDFLIYTAVPLIADPITLFVNADAPFTFNALDDLQGKSVGLLLGDSFGEAFDHYVLEHSRVEYVSTGQQNFSKLALKRIDFMPIGRLSGLLQLKHLGFDSRIIPLRQILTTEHYYLAIGRHSGLEPYLPLLDQRLAELTANGTLRRLTDQLSADYLDTH